MPIAQIAAKDLRELKARLRAFRLAQTAAAARYDANLPKDHEFPELNPSFYFELAKRGNLDVFPMKDYFWVFDQLRMADGYELDFVYILEGYGSGAEPLVYARKETEPRLICAPIPTDRRADQSAWEKLNFRLEQIQKEARPVAPYVKVTSTPSGYLQLAFFLHVVAKFYLVWHAAYSDVDFVFDHSELIQTC